MSATKLGRAVAVALMGLMIGAAALPSAAATMHGSGAPPPCDPASPDCGGTPPPTMGGSSVWIAADCFEFTCKFTATPPPDVTLTGFEWYFGDGSAEDVTETPHHTYAAEGSYYVTLNWTAASQTGEASTWVWVPVEHNSGGYGPPPDVEAWVTCLGMTCLFEYEAMIPLDSASWDFGDASPAAPVSFAPDAPDVEHTYAQDGLYNVNLYWTSGNTSGVAMTYANVPQDPFVDIEFFCDDYNCTFFVDSNYPDGKNWTWDFGDGSPRVNGVQADCDALEASEGLPPADSPCVPTHTYPFEPGNHTVRLWWVALDFAGAEHAGYSEIVVDVPFAFQWDDYWNYNDVYVEGWCWEYDCWFYTWGLFADSLTWDFGDGSEDLTGPTTGCWAEGQSETQNVCAPAHYYAEDGNYTITVNWVSGDVTGTSTFEVTVPQTSASGPGYIPPSDFYGGTVRGRVLDADTSSPISGIGVNLWMTEEDPNYGNMLWSSGYGETDEDGVYVITGLENGVYDVWASAWDTPYLEFDQEAFVTVAGATEDAETSVDAPTIKLGRGVPFAGQVLNKADGTTPIAGATVNLWGYWFGPECKGVLDADDPQYGNLVCDYSGGEPMGDHPSGDAATLEHADCPDMTCTPGADGSPYTAWEIPCDEATEICYSELDGLAGTYGWAETGADGSFSVDQLSPGLYGLWVGAPPGADLPDWYLPHERFLILNETGDADFDVLLGGTAKVVATIHADGAPLSDAWGNLWPADDATWASCGMLCGFWDGTGDDGKLAFWDVPAGKWTLWVSPPYGGGEWKYDEATNEWTYDESKVKNWAPITMVFDHTGGAKDLGTLNFVEGRSLTGKITDTDGSPVKASISVWSETTWLGGYDDTGANGTYEIPNLVPGTYNIYIWRTDGYDYSSGWVWLEDVTIGENMVYNYQFKVLGTITGTISSNPPLPGVWVSVWCEDCGGWGWDETDANGTFRIGGLPTGTYSIYAWKDGGQYLPHQTDGLTVTEGQTLTYNIVMGTGVSLSGSVCGNADCSTKVPGAEIWVWGPNGWGSGKADGSGNFVVTGLGPGTYEVYVTAPQTGCASDTGCTTQYRDFYEAGLVIPAGGLSQYQPTLGAPVTIAGTATLNGAACAGCWINVWNDELHLYGSAETGANGAFKIAGMGAGSFEVEGWDAAGNHLGYLDCTVAADGTGCNPAFTTTGLKEVAGTVKTAQNAGVADALVIVLKGSDIVAKTSTAKDGKFSLKLPNGDYKIIVSKGTQTTSGLVSITDASTVPVAVSLTLG